MGKKSSRKFVNKNNCLSVLSPDLIKSWDFEKNIGLSPDDFTVGSHKQIWWICVDNNQHIGWQASINNRYNKDSGCPHCGGTVKKTKEQFVEAANLVHNGKYTYPGVYINNKHYTDINCPIHGIFSQIPNSHLNGKGCPKCTSSVSNPETQWLNYLQIPEKYRQATIRYGENNKKWFYVDALDPNTNIIYEFHGDFYHGNPKTIVDFDEENPRNYKTYKDLFLATMEKERILKEKGYQIINIWERDWNNSAEKMIMDQRTAEVKRIKNSVIRAKNI
jgi:putative zinc ribbon protein